MLHPRTDRFGMNAQHAIAFYDAAQRLKDEVARIKPPVSLDRCRKRKMQEVISISPLGASIFENW
jgi:hypothetical protein